MCTPYGELERQCTAEEAAEKLAARSLKGRLILKNLRYR